MEANDKARIKVLEVSIVRIFEEDEVESEGAVAVTYLLNDYHNKGNE